MTLKEALAQAVEAARTVGIDPADVGETAALLHALHDAIEEAASDRKRVPWETRKGAASKQFMIQLLPYIQSFMRGHPARTAFKILDVGPGSSHGSNLLASLYQTPKLGYRASVSTIDIRKDYETYVRFFCRYITPLYGDIYKHGRRYDIVIASHVIEHVQEPLAFCRRLQEMSRGIVIVCTPYEENPEKMTRGHINRFEPEFLDKLKASRVDLLESPAWGQFVDPPYRMLVAELPGLASSAD